ncbi:hypothetical protein JXI42_03185 [bacterium]|nr:hypothetical protein [bacterium]
MMSTKVDDKKLNDVLKKAISEAIHSEFEKEIKPRLRELDKALEILEDYLLANIATERLREINEGSATLTLKDIEKKYDL